MSRVHPTHQFAELIESRQERGLPALEDFYRIRQRQLRHDAEYGVYRDYNAVMDSVLTTTTRQLPQTGKRTVSIGRSSQGGAFVVTCGQTMQPESI